MLNGLYNSPVPIQLPDGSTKVITADARYIMDSILLPEQEIAGGFKPIMPTYKNQITHEETLLLTEYIKSLGTAGGGRNSTAAEPVLPGVAASENTTLGSPSTSRPVNEPLAGATQTRNGAVPRSR